MPKQFRWKKELVLLVALLAFGAVILPFCIYFVGQQVIGEYAPEAGAGDLLRSVWAAAGERSPAAWILIASPYIVISLLRVAGRSWRVHRLESD